jgi:uncharacterized membrane-anchored protein
MNLLMTNAVFWDVTDVSGESIASMIRVKKNQRARNASSNGLQAVSAGGGALFTGWGA